jgi:Lipoate-protein ligase A
MSPPFENLLLWDRADAENGAVHMALDEGMLRLAETPALRIYRWRESEVTFGYPMRWSEVESFAAGRPATRRCTGGGLVEHGADVTVALSVPATHPFAHIAPVEAYRTIHEALRNALDDPEISLAPCGNPTSACFAAPSPHDLVSGSRKIAGGALRRSREGLLYQGSVQHHSTPADFSDHLAHALGRHVTLWHAPAEVDFLCEHLIRDRYGRTEWNRRR